MGKHEGIERKTKAGFLILRYFIYCPCVTDSVNTVYEKYYHRENTPRNRGRDDPRNRILTAEEAHIIIENQKMTKVVENKHGTVWRGKGK